jgi:hypothetical protein
VLRTLKTEQRKQRKRNREKVKDSERKVFPKPEKGSEGKRSRERALTGAEKDGQKKACG